MATLAEIATVSTRGMSAAGTPPMVNPGDAQPAPLWMAQVDSVDPTAVLDVYAFLPNSDGSGIQAFSRSGGKWAQDEKIVSKLRSISPPPMVELDRESLLAVIQQVDQFDADKEA